MQEITKNEFPQFIFESEENIIKLDLEYSEYDQHIGSFVSAVIYKRQLEIEIQNQRNFIKNELFFAVGNILLTTVCTDKSKGLFTALANTHNFGYQIEIFFLGFFDIYALIMALQGISPLIIVLSNILYHKIYLISTHF